MDQKSKKAKPISEKEQKEKTIKEEVLKTEPKLDEPQKKIINKSFYSLFKNNLKAKPPLLFSLIGFFLSLFVLMSSLSIKAQSGFVVVALVIFAIYVILVGVFALLLNLVTIINAYKHLKSTKGIITFAISILAVLQIIGSILIIYLT